MEGFLIFIGLIAAIFFGLRYLRQREIEAFRESDMADFQTFALNQKKVEPKSDDKILAKAEAFAAVNPNVVKLRSPSVTDESTDDDDILNPAFVPDPLLYEKKPASFDEMTRHMVGRLNALLPADVALLLQIPLSEFVKIDDQAGSYKLQTTKVPYVLYQKQDMTVLCGVSHQDRGDQGQGGGFVKRVFQDIGLPLLEFPVGIDISDFEIRDQLDPVLLNREDKQCPKCGESMALRKAMKGKHAGKVYWVCSQFPGCRGVLQAS